MVLRKDGTTRLVWCVGRIAIKIARHKLVDQIKPWYPRAMYWRKKSVGPSLTDAVEKGLRTSPNSDSADSMDHLLGGGDDGAAE
jgi:hypothetical protein